MDLQYELPKRIVSVFSNVLEVGISVSYRWLQRKCDCCSKFGHESRRCSAKPLDSTRQTRTSRRSRVETKVSRGSRGQEGVQLMYGSQHPRMHPGVDNLAILDDSGLAIDKDLEETSH